MKDSAPSAEGGQAGEGTELAHVAAVVPSGGSSRNPMFDHSFDDDRASLASTSDASDAAAKPYPRRWARVAVGVAALVVVAVGVALAIATVHYARSRITVPTTASFSFTSTWPNAPNGPNHYTGRVHKTVDDDGEWLVTGRVWFNVPNYNRTSILTTWDGRVYIRDIRHDAGVDPVGPTGAGTGRELLRAGCLADGGPFPDAATLRSSYVDASQLGVDQLDLFSLASKPTCDSGEPWVITLGGETVAFCGIGSSPTAAGVGVSEASGEDFVAQVFDVRTGSAAGDAIVTSPPLGMDGQPLDCPRIPSLEVRNAGTTTATSRRLGEVAAERKRKLSTKRCIFMHGSGYTTDSATTSTFTEAWGNVHASSGCSSTVFLHRDTVTKTWEDPAMQNYFCDVAAGGHSNHKIENTMVFTAGFGTLMVAAALKNAKCRMHTGAEWFVASSMGEGSEGAEYLDGLCTNYNTYLDELNTQYHLCSGSGSTRTLNDGYKSLMPSYNPLGSVSWQDIRDTLQTSVDGAICGTSPWGLDNSASYSMDAMASESGMKSTGDSDGFVLATSCYSGTSQAATAANTAFGTSYGNAFYKPSVNHLDVTCLYGDGVYSYRKPCKWYDSR